MMLVRCGDLEWRVVSRVIVKEQEQEQTGRAVAGLFSDAMGASMLTWLSVCGEGLGYQWQKRNK
jgi:hypothetical protein